MRYLGTPSPHSSAPPLVPAPVRQDGAVGRLPRRLFLRRCAGPTALAAGIVACAPATATKLVRPISAGQGIVLAEGISQSGQPIQPPADVSPVTQPQAEAAPAAAPPPPPRIPVFYRPEYTMAGYSYETTRKAQWVADSLAADPLATLEVVSPEPLAESDVTVVHDPGYVAAVRTGQPRALAQSQGWPWDPGVFPMVLASNGGAVAAAQAALHTGVAGSLSSGLHHARRARGNGNCTFNGLALAARTLLAGGVRRILVLDLDAHCGGGTDELLGREPAVHITDVAVYPFDVYTPHQQNTLDMVQFAPNYLPTIRRRLDALDGSAFDVCLYNAGMDPHQGCSLGGLPGITADVLAARERLVFDWCRQNNLPISFVLAGGYLGPTLDQNGLTALHRLTLAAAAQMPVRSAAA